MFLDLRCADFRLAQYATGTPFQSPCIDSGNALANDTFIKLAGNSRPLSSYTTRSDNRTDEGIVDMGYHYAVGAEELNVSVMIAMNSDINPGKFHNVESWFFNPGEPIYNCPVIFAFQIYGTFFFWPDWSQDFDYMRMNNPMGVWGIEILPSFIFYESSFIASNNCWAFCAMLQDDLTSVLGEMDAFQWTLR